MNQDNSVLHYSDYRAFLISHAQHMKTRNQRWSYGAWAKRLGLKTTSSITKIVQGKRNPGDSITEKLVDYFKFSPQEAHYFRDLIRLHKVKKDPRLAVVLMEKMHQENPKSPIKLIDLKTFSVISNWYCLTIREMTRVDNFVEDPEWISKNLEFDVTPTDVSRAIKLLISVNLLERDESGRLQIRETSINTADDLSSEAIKQYHEHMLDHAKDAVRKFDVKERDFNSLTLNIDARNLDQAKEMVRNFKWKFEQALAEENGNHRIYQFQTQLFPLTKASGDIKDRKGDAE